jgi:hypothetical protein
MNQGWRSYSPPAFGSWRYRRSLVCLDSRVEDRIAKTVAKIYIEPSLGRLFHPDS